MSFYEWEPCELDYIWQWFGDLSDWRDSAFGLGPISHQEIESWARLFRLDISPAEVDALRRIDREFRIYHNKKNAPPEAPSLSQSLQQISEANEAKRKAAEKKPPPVKKDKPRGR